MVYSTDESDFDFEQINLLFMESTSPAELIQHFTQWVVPRSGMRGAVPTLPHTPSWRGAELSTGRTLSLAFYLDIYVN
jgi:hypothetical protein